MDIAPVSAQSLGAVVVPQAATPGVVPVPAPPGPGPGAAPTAAARATRAGDSVQISAAARRAMHRRESMPTVDELATQDEAALTDLASTYRQAFGDRMQALGFTVPDPSSAGQTDQATAQGTAATPTDASTASAALTAAASTDASTSAADSTSPASTSPTVTPPPDASTSTAVPQSSDATATATSADSTAAPTSPTSTSAAPAQPSPQPTTSADVMAELNATLKKLQANADKSIELAAAGVPTGNDHQSRYAQFLARRQIGYVTDLTRAAMQHAKQVADYTLDQLPRPANSGGQDGSNPPPPTTTPTPTPSPTPTPTPAPTPTPTVTPPPTPTPTVTPPPDAGNGGNGSTPPSSSNGTPGAPDNRWRGTPITVSQINALRRSAQMQLHQLAMDTTREAARIEQAVDDQLGRWQDSIAGDASGGSGGGPGADSTGSSYGGPGAPGQSTQSGYWSNDPWGGLRMNGGNPPRAGGSSDWAGGWPSPWPGQSGSGGSSDPSSGNAGSSTASTAPAAPASGSGAATTSAASTSAATGSTAPTNPAVTTTA